MNLHPSALLQAALDTLKNGQACVLATLISAEGSSPRRVGSQLLIREDGSWQGMISSGCIEQAIVGQALEALAEGSPRTLRYGKGSPWFDLQLPCGSGIDVHLCVHLDVTLLQDTLDKLQARKSVRWVLDDEGHWRLTQKPLRDAYTQLYTPRWQMLALGRGPALAALAAIAKPCEIDVHVYSADECDLNDARPFALSVHSLKHPDSFDCPKLDRYSAAVTLFHDHDWEPVILQALLQSNAAYLAALGSPRSHAARLMQMTQNGVSAKQLARIKGPAGLHIHASTPAEIALSIVAEMVQRMRG